MAIRKEDIPRAYIGLSCGCGRIFRPGDAVYEVYGNQLHCQLCFEDAIESQKPVLVRRLK